MIKNNRSAFTLAEMMIVMLILTILLAAFAPLMTKKSKVDLSNPWRWANNNSDIYYGIGNNQTAMIGQNNKAATDSNAKLLINQSDIDRPYISFKSGNTNAGGIFIDPTRGSLWMHANANVYSEDLDGDTAFGIDAMSAGNSYYGSTAFGYGAMRYSNGARNTAIGVYALQGQADKAGLIEAGDNTAVGNGTLRNNQVGHYSGGVAPGSQNTAIGSSALMMNTTGHGNTAVGYSALYSNKTGSSNVALGSSALYDNTTGHANIAIGNNACKNVTGSNKICLGSDSGPASTGSNIDPYRTTADKVIYLGDADTTVYIPGHLVVDKYAILGKAGDQYTTFQRFEGYGSSVAGNPILGSMRIIDNTLSVVPWNGHTWYSEGGTSVRSIVSSPTFAIPGPNGISPDEISHIGTGSSSGRTSDSSGSSGRGSDIALKNVQGEFVAGLQEIKQLKPFNYTYKKDTNKEPQVGVMAQDLQKVFPTSVSKHDDGYLYIRWDEMFYASINAIKELDKMLQDLIAQVKTVVAQVAEHDTQIKALQKENQELKNKVQNLEEQNKAFEKRLKAIEKKL